MNELHRLDRELRENLPRPPRIGSVQTSTLWIVEWLSEREVRTGQELGQWANKRRPGWVAYNHCRNKVEVLQAIRKAADFARTEQASPILHMEAHGNADGLCSSQCGDPGEFLAWEDLTPYLQDLNLATKGNLILVTAACHGFASVLASTRGPIAPCIATVGAVGTLTSSELLGAMQELYRGWMDHSPKLEVIADSAARETATLDMETESFVEVAYESMTDLLLERLKSGDRWIEDRANFHWLPRRFQKYWDTMFMINRFPENRIRFGLDVRLMVATILASRGLR